MRIVNATGHEISYELRGGPLRMVLSTCDLAPGEEETWTARYRTDEVACEVTVTLADERLRIEARDADTVIVEPFGDEWRLRLA